MNPLNRLPEQALRVVVGLQQERRDRGHEHRLRDPRRAVCGEIAGHLARAHRVPDQRRVAQVELLHQGAQVRGEGVVVVAGRRLAGLPEPAPVIGDHPAAGVQQHRELPVPRAAAEGIAVDQDDGRSRAVILVVEVDRPRVLLTHRDVRHATFLSRDPKSRVARTALPANRDSGSSDRRSRSRSDHPCGSTRASSLRDRMSSLANTLWR